MHQAAQYPSTEAANQTGIRSLIAALVMGRGVDQMLSPECSESNFLKQLNQEGMTALVAFRLKAASSAGLHEISRRTLQRQLHNAVAQEMLRRKEIGSIVSVLAAGGIKTLLLKGAPLSYLIYSQPYLRPLTDTDLFIPAADQAKARRLLEALGCYSLPSVTGKLVSHQFSMVRRSGSGSLIHLDIHWKISNPQAFCNLLTIDEMWAERLPVAELGPDAYGPSLIHALLHALIHRVAHYAPSNRMIWLYDIHLLGEALGEREWRLFIDRAIEKRIGAVSLNGLESALALFPSTKGKRWLLELKQRIDPHREFTTRIYLKHEQNSLTRFRSDLSQLNWRDKLGLIREHLFPPANYLLNRYGRSSRFTLPYLYLHRIGSGLLKTVRRHRG